VHGSSTKAEFIRDLVIQVRSHHSLSLEVKERLVLKGDADRCPRLQDSLVDDIYPAQHIIHSIVLSFHQFPPAGCYFDRSLRNVHGVEHDLRRTGGRVFPSNEELVLFGYLLRLGLGGVIKLLKYIFAYGNLGSITGQAVAKNTFKVLPERLKQGEEDPSVGGIDCNPVHEVKNPVGIGILLGVHFIQAQLLDQDGSVKSLFRNVVNIVPGFIVTVKHIQGKILFTNLVGSQRIDVFHHQIPGVTIGRKVRGLDHFKNQCCRCTDPT